jgi:hypothetical protein
VLAVLTVAASLAIGPVHSFVRGIADRF